MDWTNKMVAKREKQLKRNHEEITSQFQRLLEDQEKMIKNYQ